MRAVTDDTKLISQDHPLSRREKLISCGVIAVVLAVLLLERATLVDQMPFHYTILGAILGFAGGVGWSLRLKNVPGTETPWRRTLGLAAIPIFGLFLGTFLARSLFDEFSFIGLNPESKQVLGQIVKKRQGKYGGYYASFTFGRGTRQLEGRVTFEVYSNLEPWTAPGRDCLLIGIQTGRNGVRRTFLPNVLDAPIQVDHYQRCPAKFPEVTSAIHP